MARVSVIFKHHGPNAFRHFKPDCLAIVMPLKITRPQRLPSETSIMLMLAADHYALTWRTPTLFSKEKLQYGAS